MRKLLECRDEIALEAVEDVVVAQPLDRWVGQPPRVYVAAGQCQYLAGQQPADRSKTRGRARVPVDPLAVLDRSNRRRIRLEREGQECCAAGRSEERRVGKECRSR